MFIDIDEYDTKVSSYMSDTQLFEEMHENPHFETVEKEKKFINILRNNSKTKEFIGVFELNTLNLAKFYGTLEHHNALRPIISTIGSPGYTLGKALS